MECSLAFFSAHQSVKGRAPQPGFGLAHVKDRDVSQQALLGEAVVELFGKGGVGERGHAQGHAAGDVQAAKGQGGENVIAAGPAVEAGEPFQGLGKCQGAGGGFARGQALAGEKGDNVDQTGTADNGIADNAFDTGAFAYEPGKLLFLFSDKGKVAVPAFSAVTTPFSTVATSSFSLVQTIA